MSGWGLGGEEEELGFRHLMSDAKSHPGANGMRVVTGPGLVSELRI